MLVVRRPGRPGSGGLYINSLSSALIGRRRLPDRVIAGRACAAASIDRTFTPCDSRGERIGGYQLRIRYILLLSLVAISGCGRDRQPAPSAEPTADLVLRGGIVATADPEIGIAEALAIEGHTIVAIGSDEDIAGRIGPDTHVVELEGRFAAPGFIESHAHLFSLGQSMRILDLNDVSDWDEIVSMVAVAADKAKPGEWILGRGWHQDKWDSVPADAVDGAPRNDTLNAAAPNNPVELGHASGHASFVNDSALAVAGIDDDTPDPPGGTIVRTPAGRATGYLRETAQRIVDRSIQDYEAQLSPAEAEQIERERVALASDEALRNGVTSFHGAGEGTVPSFKMLDFLKKLEDEGALSVRYNMMVRTQTPEELDQLLPHYKWLAEGNDFLTVRSIKKQIDGALGAHGAWLLEPYTDLPETSGLVLDTLEEIEQTAVVAVKHGFQVNTHAIGDRANREVLDIYERVWEEAGVDGSKLRWRIEHAQHIDPEDIQRFADLGVIAAVQGIHGTSDGPWIPDRLGEERAEITSYRWRDLIDAGAVVSNGTDAPVERINPIASFYATVSRMTVEGERFHPQQAMTREEALASYTINGAYAAFEEEIKGSLTPGKLADIVVLSRDILSVPEEEIPGTQVDMTIVGGEIKYTRSSGHKQRGVTIVSDIEDMLAQLKQKRDELRVQIHLGSKEVQEEWQELEEKMEDFSQKAKLGETGEGLGSAFGQVGNELKQGYTRIRDALKDD